VERAKAWALFSADQRLGLALQQEVGVHDEVHVQNVGVHAGSTKVWLEPWDQMRQP
jgi:hypothetical protein